MKDDCLLVVLTDVDQSIEREWNDWYDAVHLPNMLEVPELSWAARYDIVADEHSLGLPYRYATVQGFASLEHFRRYRASARFPALRQEYSERYGGRSELGRIVLTKRENWRGRERGANWR